MWRWLFRVTAGLSLLLLIAAVGVWVRSYWVYDVMSRQCIEFNSDGTENTLVWFQSWRGTFVVSRQLSTTPRRPADKAQQMPRCISWVALPDAATKRRPPR